MEPLERLKTRLNSTDDQEDQLLSDFLETAKWAILNRRFPCADSLPDEIEPRYVDLQIRIAIDLYNKIGAEGQSAHSENGVSRTYEASEVLLSEITPQVKVL